MTLISTTRLSIRPITLADAAFYLQLVNNPSWLQYIGDRNIHSLAEAQTALQNGAVAMQQKLGFSLYLTLNTATGLPVGICGLIKREELEDIDLGYAFLPQYQGQGYAREAAEGVMSYAKDTLQLKRLLAITDVDNQKSIQLLEKLNFKFIKKIVYGKESNLFSCEL